MSIEILTKNKARLYASFGSGTTRERKSKTITYNGKKDLERQHQEFIKDFSGATDYEVSLRELVEDYIRSRELLGAEATTIRGYKIDAMRINSRLERLSAADVTTYHLDNFIAEMQEKYAPKTIKNTMSLISSAYKKAIKSGLLDHNPCEYITLPKGKKKDIKTLEEKSVMELILHLKDGLLDYKVGYELCLFCGLRRSEVLGLTPADINLDFKTVTVNKSRHRVRGKDIIQTTKTERSHRTLALPDFLCDEIKELIELHNSYRFEKDNFLILDAFGIKRNPSTFTNYLSRLERKCGIENVSVHGLRHTYASMLNASGIDIARISQELGHSTISTTMNIYLHTFGNASASSRGIADTLNDKFSENGQISVKSDKVKTP